jgi:hypothetical protein
MKRTAMLLVSCLAMLALASTASAQGGYDISWWTVSGGGHTFSSGDSYTLGGTIGQPATGIMLGGSYGLDGGFWPRVIPVYPVYVPVVMRNY